MILFKDDWKKYPHAIVDTSTRNKSWLRLAGLYKKMGIKNHTFLLALHNRELRGIDPRSPEVLANEELMGMIIDECIENPWYYFREVMKVVPPAGAGLLDFRANRANIAYIWLVLNHITTYLIQPRQTGKSLTGDGMDSYMCDLGAMRSNISILTKDDALRTRTSVAMKEIIETLPPYLQLVGKKDIKNSERITCRALDNEIKLYVGQKDKKAADNLGRGMRSPMVRIDEFAYVYNIQITLPVLLAATTAAREVAREQNNPYYTTFTTTPGKLNTKEGKFAYEVYKSAMRWTEKLFDCKDRDELVSIMEKNSREYKLILLEFNHRQLGFTDEWLKERLKAAMSKGDEQTRSDFFNEWVAGTMKSPVSREQLNIITKSKVKDSETFIAKHGYVFKQYETIKSSDWYVIGVDTSDALGQGNDDIGIVVRKASDGAVVLAGKFNETNLTLFSDMLSELLITIPNSTLIIERKSSGTAILDNMFTFLIEEGINPFRRIFNRMVNGADDPKLKSEAKKLLSTIPTLSILAKYKAMFGYATAGSGEYSRSLLYGNVFNASIKYTADKVRDPDLIDQLSSLTIKNNRIDHEEGGHDDMVIGWLLGFWFLMYGKNKYLYGIPNDKILIDIVDTEILHKNQDMTKTYIQKQYELKKEIQELTNKLKNIENEYVAIKYYSRIIRLSEKLDPRVVSNFNLDAMLEDIKIMKKLKKYISKT